MESIVVDNQTGEVTEIVPEVKRQIIRYKMMLNELCTDKEMDFWYMYQAMQEQADERRKLQYLPMARDHYQATGEKTIKGDYMDVSYLIGHTSKKLDVQKLKEEMPEIYEKYCKDCYVKESVRVIIK